MGVPKTVEQARENFETVLPYIRGRYERGVEVAEWEKAAASDEAERNFNTQMSRVLAERLRQAGVRRAGDVKWRSGALTKGAPVITERIRAALDVYATNFGKVYSHVLAKLRELPRRGIDPMANIDARLKPVVETWVRHKLKGRR